MERSVDGKKIAAITTIVLVFAMAIILVFCGWEARDPNAAYIRKVGDKLLAPTCEPAEVELCCLAPFWNDMLYKTVSGSYGGQLAQALSELKPNGQSVPALAEENAAGSLWAEFDNRIYRMHEEQLALVQERFGEGQLLADSEEARRLLGMIWARYPSDTYFGEYKDGVLELEHQFAGDSAVSIQVVGFSVNHEADTHFGSEGSVRFRLLSKKDWTGQVQLHAYSSSDNGTTTRRETVNLRAGIARELTMDFEGWSTGYWLEIWADKTLVQIHISGNTAS